MSKVNTPQSEPNSSKDELLEILYRLKPEERYWAKLILMKVKRKELSFDEAEHMVHEAKLKVRESGKGFLECFYDLFPDVLEVGGYSHD